MWTVSRRTRCDPNYADTIASEGHMGRHASNESAKTTQALASPSPVQKAVAPAVLPSGMKHSSAVPVHVHAAKLLASEKRRRQRGVALSPSVA